MPTMDELLAERDVHGLDVDHLHRLVADWQLLADLSFADLILFVPSALFCGIGLIWAFGDSRRRCWHDLATGAYPVEARA